MADPLYSQAMSGSLNSPQQTPGTNIHITFTNSLPIPVLLFWVDSKGNQLASGLGVADGIPGMVFQILSGSTTPGMMLYGNYVVTTANTGSFVAVLEVKPEKVQAFITTDILTHPNDIGMPPVPDKTTLIPNDSPRVLIACGRLPNNNIIMREQYWKRAADSYSLAPASHHTIGSIVTKGLEKTSSTEKSISEALGMNASAGWGAFSASISASLSASSTTTQQVSTSTKTTQYETLQLSNETDTTKIYLKWQLMDVFTIFGSADLLKPISYFEIAQFPIITMGPYSPL